MARLAERIAFTAAGEIDLPSGGGACELTVDLDGVVARDGERVLILWPAHEIARVTREDYDIVVANAFDEQLITLRRFARRTDELEIALRRARADALAELMAPPGKVPMDVFEAGGEGPGLLYRYDDGLRWVPHAGDCTARLYSEVGVVTFDEGSYDLVLSGPFGETRLGGLKRVTRELASETTRHIEEARRQFADALERAGLPWGSEALSGAVLAHVPLEATEERLQRISKSRIICDERREYWDVLVSRGAVERLVLSPDADGLRVVALCRLRTGELYETLSEADHASFVFESADDVVRAWTEVGFRREPIFTPAEREPAAALARVLPSLTAARRGMVGRVIHDEPQLWQKRLF